MTDNTPPSSSKKRGVTKLVKLFKSRHEEKKIRIEVVNGQPVPSKNYDQFASFVGMIARRNVPISYQKWKDVPKELKAKLWDEIIRTFEGVDEIQHDIFISMGESWRTWKSRLYTQYVKNVDDPEALEAPPADYDFISPEDWQAFVAYRSTPQFLEISGVNIEKAKQQKYFHTTSRKGYAGLRSVMEEKSGGTPIPREELWKAAHKKKSGQFVSEDASLVAQRIDDLATQASEGLLEVHGKDDILSRVIGPEHPGRVRAGGKHVIPSKYFKDDRRRRSSVHGDEVASIRAELEAQKRTHNEEMSAMKEKMDKMYAMFMAQQHGSVPPSTSAHVARSPSPHTPPTVAEPLLQKGMEVELYIDGIDGLIRVGSGNIIHPGGAGFVLHTEAQPSYGMCSVVVTHIYESTAPLPCPHDEVSTVGEASGYVLGWPTQLVKPTTEVPFPGQITYAPGTSFLQKLEQFFEGLASDGYHIEFDFGMLNVGRPIATFIAKEEIEHLMKFDRIENSIILSAIGLFYTKIKEDGADSFIYFFNAEDIYVDKDNTKVTQRAEKLNERLHEIADNSLLFIPYNNSAHWMLALVDRTWLTIYWLDPLGRPIRDDLKKVIHEAFKIYTGKKRITINVETINCPRQPDSNSCGYYIIEYMKILTSYLEDNKITSDFFKGKASKTFTQEQLETTREEVAEYIYKKLAM